MQSKNTITIVHMLAGMSSMNKLYMQYHTFGYLCGNIIYANYASSCEGA